MSALPSPAMSTLPAWPLHLPFQSIKKRPGNPSLIPWVRYPSPFPLWVCFLT